MEEDHASVAEDKDDYEEEKSMDKGVPQYDLRDMKDINVPDLIGRNDHSWVGVF